jgi:glycosyltransferase involved in cell wall biosynthesis
VLDHLRNVRLCSDNASVVYDGFDIESYPPPRKQESKRIIAGEMPFPAEASILTCIGRIDRGKQQHLLIEMMRHLDADVHLLLVGAREDSRYEDELRTLIGRYDLGRRVHFTGYRRDIPRILDATDVSFLPSSNEGLGNAIVESFIMRVPVIASSIPPIREIIDDGVSGYCVPGSDVAGYVRRTRELLADSGKREAFAQKGREKVEKLFSRESFVQGSTQALVRALDHRRFAGESP